MINRPMKRTKKILLCFLLPLIATNLLAQSRPNILWITIEDTSPQFIGCYGNKHAQTPHIDQLAKEGVRFTNAFSTNTVCSPSRSSIITGVRTYETGTGHHRSAYPIPGFMHGFPYYLRKAGYYTSNNFKTDYNIAGAKNFTDEAWNESSTAAGWWKRQPGEPFFAVFNFMDSHQSRTMTDSYETYVKEVLDQLPAGDRIGEQDFDMPPFYRNSPEMRRQFARVYNALKLTDNKIGELLQKLREDHLADSTIIFFFSDHGQGIPRAKTNGIGLGYRVPFVIWFPQMYQHLSPWGTGLVTDEMISFEDLAPTILSLADAGRPDYLKGRILTGSKRSKPVDHLILSSDRSDNGIDMIRTVTDGRYIYSRNYLPFMPELRYIRYVQVADITQQMHRDFAANRLNRLQKRLFEQRPAEVLYDTKNDPWETRNLADDPASEKLLQQMRRQLDQAILRSRDVMFLPEYEIGLLAKTTTPYEYRLNKENYPIREIYNAAALSGKRSGNVARQQVKLLASRNRIVRYWAMVGLRSQPGRLLQSYRTQIMQSLHDDYAPVAITAAAIAYQEWQSGSAADYLMQSCQSGNMDLALMAINYLLYVNNKQPFVETIKTVHQMPGSNYNVKAACMDFLGSLGLVPNTIDFEK